jgi:hypothetical protein
MASMKKVFAILLIVLLGVALGVGMATLRIKAAPWNPGLDQGEPAAAPPSKSGDKPAMKVAQIGRAAGPARFDEVG